MWEEGSKEVLKRRNRGRETEGKSQQLADGHRWRRLKWQGGRPWRPHSQLPRAIFGNQDFTPNARDSIHPSHDF